MYLLKKHVVYEESIMSVNKPMLRDTAYDLSKLISYNL